MSEPHLHRIIEHSPKQKLDLRRRKNTDALPTVPPFPTGEKASGSQDSPEPEHPSKGNPGRPRNNQEPKPNTQGPPPVRKNITTKTKSQNQQDPTMTPNRI